MIISEAIMFLPCAGLKVCGARSFAMVQFMGTVCPPSRLSLIVLGGRKLPLRSSLLFLGASPRFSSFKPIFQACLRSNFSSKNDGDMFSSSQSEVIFMGTGTSEGIPRVSCLTNPLKQCPVCSKAVEPANKNKRLNTSILIRYSMSTGIRNILVDAGKFFYHSALRWFPAFGIRTIDAVIITHSHADAIGGLDDLRDWTNNVQPSIPIYVAQRDFEVMKKTHYYLVDTRVISPGAAVSELQFNIIQEDPFVVHGLKITPLPVWHGQGYRSLGFRFGNVCYISDASDIPEETYQLLKDSEILILDALRPDRSSATHFGLPRALEEVRKIQPKRALFTGMMHLMDHEKVNNYLMNLKESEGLDVQLSYDGLRVPELVERGKENRRRGGAPHGKKILADLVDPYAVSNEKVPRTNLNPTRAS